MSCITEILKIKGDKEFLPVSDLRSGKKEKPFVVIEGGGSFKKYE